MEIAPSVLQLRKGQYRNRRAKDTLNYISTKTGVIVEEGLKRKLIDRGFDLQDERDNKSVYEPQMMFDQLERYTQLKPMKVDEKSWDQAYRITLGAFVPKWASGVLEQNTDKEFLRSRIKGNKASGAPEFTTKAEAFEKDFARMHRWLKGEKSAEPCICFHRVQHGEEGPKNRMVWGYPLSVGLAEMTFAEPIKDYFQSNRLPIPLGLHKIELNARMQVVRNQRYVYQTDFSRFDSTQNVRLIRMAFSVLRHLFDWSKSDRHTWDLIENYYIHTPVIMPDGFIYVVHQGAPSGSNLITEVNTIINFFSAQYAFIRLGRQAIKPECQLPYGDDNVIGSDYYFTREEVARAYAELGLTVSVEKTYITSGMNKQLHYLGHIWYGGKPHRETWDVARHMVYPEKPSREMNPKQRIFDRIYPYIADSVEGYDVLSSLVPYDDLNSALVDPEVVLTRLPEWYAINHPEDYNVHLTGEALLRFAAVSLFK